MSSHNLAGVPRLASSRNAVSGLMPRRPATISCMRCGGTRSFKAKAFADKPRASSSSFKIAPGWTCWNANCVISSSSMVIDNFYIMGVSVLKTENQAPRAVDRHRPLALPVANKRMKTNRFKRWNVIQRACCVQNLQPGECFGDVQSRKFRFAFAGKAFGRPIGEANNHSISNNTLNMAWQACCKEAKCSKKS